MAKSRRTVQTNSAVQVKAEPIVEMWPASHCGVIRSEQNKFSFHSQNQTSTD